MPKRYLTKDEIRTTLIAHSAWLQGEPNGRRADFSNADLSGVNLAYADLARANFADANLSRAWLHGADFTDADVSRVDWSGAHVGDVRGLRKYG